MERGSAGSVQVAPHGDRDDEERVWSLGRRPLRIWRSIGAVIAGLLAIVVLDSAFDFILHSTGIYPPVGQTMADGLFLLALAYRIVDAIIGCSITAWLAPSRPMLHALTLGGIGVVLSTLGVLATLSGGPELGPLWYPISLMVVALPCAWVAGRLVESKQRGPTEVRA
jgi:hypothetical protein